MVEPSTCSQVHCGGSTRAATGCGVSVARAERQQVAGKKQDLGPGRQCPLVGCRVLFRRNEDAVEANFRADCFLDEIGSFQADETGAGWIGERSPQFFQARVLLTLYNAYRHLGVRPNLLVDSMPFDCV